MTNACAEIFQFVVNKDPRLPLNPPQIPRDQVYSKAIG